MNTKGFFSLIIILSFSIHTVYSQYNKKHIEKIDNLFTSWNAPNHPGGSIMVVKNGTTIFSKAYGLASLEYSVSNTTNTLFNIGSISKQFTAMGIVLLEEQNKLSFNDNIRKHLTELPDFGKTITIRHLLNHTSGLRDIHGLLGIAGWRSMDVETNEDIYRILKNQKDLNYEPGKEFLYCNTGYILLAKIIEKISETSFRNWMTKNIFDPLGMKDTYVQDQYDQVALNNATSYYSSEEIKRAIDYWGYYGSGNMYSTTADLNLWLQNFITSEKKWAKPFQKLLTVTPLTNGFYTNYGFGVRVEKHMGRKVIQHGGAVGGFRSIVKVYPEEQFKIIILSNFSGGDIYGKSNKITQIVLGNKDIKQEKKQEKQSQKVQVSLSNKNLSKFEGIYWSSEEKYGRIIYLKNDTLRYKRPSGNEYLLAPVSKNSFQILNTNEDIFLSFDTKTTTPKITVSIPNQIPGVLEFHQSITKDNIIDPIEYIGDYYSPELRTTYSISLENSDLYCEHVRHGKIKMIRLFNDIFKGDWPISTLEIKRDHNGKVHGIYISNGRTRNVWFKKN
ncbi:serine hydrolase domain-containing protein [Aquimarina sp. SS2-1]|uniref:serine hydrolase domain-containing protein n=1 Tax=Aquimarina besae TaxID=3342247 RepID=UPI00366C35AB